MYTLRQFQADQFAKAMNYANSRLRSLRRQLHGENITQERRDEILVEIAKVEKDIERFLKHPYGRHPQSSVSFGSVSACPDVP